MEAAPPNPPVPVERGPGFSPHWRRTLTLWLGMLAPPAAWALQLQAVYVMVPLACQTHHRWPLHLTTAGLLGLALAGGWLAWRDWRAVGGGWPRDAESGPGGRARFLAVGGMGLSALFSLVIAGQWVYVFAINPCVE
ncbi:MAG: hypothetical protein JWO31_2460 [Phycisphaerales bacterium]|nr:hypothetical protein [Phycisphaerales bacterium]